MAQKRSAATTKQPNKASVSETAALAAADASEGSKRQKKGQPAKAVEDAADGAADLEKQVKKRGRPAKAVQDAADVPAEHEKTDGESKDAAETEKPQKRGRLSKGAKEQNTNKGKRGSATSSQRPQARPLFSVGKHVAPAATSSASLSAGNHSPCNLLGSETVDKFSEELSGMSDFGGATLSAEAQQMLEVKKHAEKHKRATSEDDSFGST